MGTRRNHKKSRANRVLFVLACAVIGLSAVYYASTALHTKPVERTPDLSEKFVPVPDENARFAEEARLVYPYSVIPGGIRSREELAAYVATDKVVADHYRDFDVRSARIVEADKTRMMYVSYRVGDQVYWTKKQVKIPEGEMLISDGECEGRLRCGNRVSASPMGPASDEEPLVETFDMPQLVRVAPPKLPENPLLAQLDTEQLPEYVPPPFTGLDLGVVSVPDRSYQPLPSRQIDSEILMPETPLLSVSVPEPGILTLLITGLASIFAIRLFRKE
jgi:hypothetical protein